MVNAREAHAHCPNEQLKKVAPKKLICQVNNISSALYKRNKLYFYRLHPCLLLSEKFVIDFSVAWLNESINQVFFVLKQRLIKENLHQCKFVIKVRAQNE